MSCLGMHLSLCWDNLLNLLNTKFTMFNMTRSVVSSMINRGNKNKNCEVIHSGIFEMSQWMQWMELRAMTSRPIAHAFMHFNINTSESAAIYINISKLNTANVIILQNY
jgi:hypothetical protein